MKEHPAQYQSRYKLNAVGMDVIIVGGGIVGACIAYHARQVAPDLSILLLEQGRIGGGASGSSAGFDAIESPSETHRDLAIRSRLLYRHMKRQIPEAAVTPVLTHWIIGQDRRLTFNENFRSSTHDFSNIDLEEEAPEGFLLDPDHVIFRDEHNGFADPGSICRGIVRYLRAHSEGFACWEGVEVAAVVKDGVILRDGRKVTAKHVVVAIGPWLLGALSADLMAGRQGLHTKKIASLLIDRCPPPTSSAVVFDEQDAFFLPHRRERRWLFSFTLKTWDSLPSLATCLDEEEFQLGLHLLARLAPDLVQYVSGAQVFWDTYTADHLPLVYSPEKFPNITVVTGCSGGGYRIAPALAQDTIAGPMKRLFGKRDLENRCRF